MTSTEIAEPRRLALKILTAVLKDGQRMDLAISCELDEAAGLAERDRAFAHTLAVGTLRHLGGLDDLISHLLERPLPRRAGDVMQILRLGLFQLLFLNIPDHAAVDSSVRLLDRRHGTAFRGLVNALLRRAAREREGLLTRLRENPGVYLPPWLARRWQKQFGPDVLRRMIAVQLGEPPMDLTLQRPSDASDISAALEAEVLAPGRLRLTKPAQPRKLPGFADGAWWVQDIAASLPVTLFGQLEGRDALDLCAAPGGKTLQLAAAGARVTAVDRSAARLALLNDNLERTGLVAETIAADMLSFTTNRQFDCVLLDAPCTATGTLRRHPDVMWRRKESDIAQLAALQRRMLEHAFGLVRSGGSLVYCVCSLEPEEGEQQIAAFLNGRPDAAASPPPADWFAGPPKHLLPSGGAITRPDGLARAGGMDGFFMARIDRAD